MSKSTSNIRYINLTQGTSLAAYIAETCVRANKLKDRIQIAAVGILSHVGTHNNKPQAVKFANDLVDGLGQGIQVSALIDWFTEFGMVIADDGKGFGDVNMDKLKAGFQQAKKVHWVSFAPANVWAGFKLDEKLEALFKSAKDATERANKSTEEAAVVSIDQAKLSVLQVVAGLDAAGLQALVSQMNLGRVEESSDTVVTEDFTAGLEEETEEEVAA